MSPTQRTLVAVSGGLSLESSTRRLIDRLVASAQRQAAAVDMNLTVVMVDLREHARELGEGQVTGSASGPLQDAIDSLDTADALIVGSPTFKASYSGLFKSFWDLTLDGSIAGLPTLLAATGGSSRHSLMIEHYLRPLFSYLKALVMPTTVFAAAEDWAGDELEARIDRAAEELVAQLCKGAVFGEAQQAAAEAGLTVNAVERAREADPFLRGEREAGRPAT